ncbi:unnamed protein product [Aureobasidium mustum]|uniref:CCCH zinc finger and SMR domain-containing protein n=1 Tax=Aureobasidium mustum TaxID=2773714 RepID=A0A9N8JP76_9PEZI|nr:unnamed protein product [Aureobasidium mustum]
MVSDTVYEICLPVLQDPALPEDEKADRVEDVLRQEARLTGKALEDAVLGVLWRHRDTVQGSTSPPPLRASVIRRPSPAPWQPRSATNSPRSQSATIRAPPGFGSNPQFSRAKSSTASPFSSPRPSPRLAFATPQIPHSPSLSAYQFSEPTSSTEQYGDYGSDNVDWIVNDDASSNASFGDSAFASYPSDWVQPSMVEMSTYDMLRSVLRDEKSDEELEHVLQLNGYDFSQTIMALADPQALTATEAQNRTYLVGKSMSPTSRPLTPSTQSKSGIVCKYWLSSGHCARADCRFSHDLSNHLCKYWLAGTCLAGESCIFSHDPSALMTRLTMDENATPPSQSIQPNFQLQDYDSFPALQPTNSNPYDQSYDPSMLNSLQSQPPTVSTLNPFAMFVPSSNASVQSSSRPNSRHQSRTATPSTLAVNDDEAFPTLGSAAASRSSRRHGKRGHGNTANKESPVPIPSSLADVVRMTPSPSPQIQTRRGLRSGKSNTGSRENSAAAMAIAAPEHIPWLETGESANKAYLKARAEAFRHGGLRNKYLQAAAQSWNRNDARGAKALSLRGHNENLAMKEAHREAARCLYEERNKGNGIGELFVDLHGLHPEEAVQYLTSCLLDHSSSNKPVYAICGTGHHSKNGKDKVGKAVRQFLNEWHYAFREFSVPGDRNNVGGILGIDPSSYDRDCAKKMQEAGPISEADSGVGFLSSSAEDTKVRILRREEQ